MLTRSVGLVANEAGVTNDVQVMNQDERQAPTLAQIRRALRRAKAGKSLDLREATTLLHARDEEFDELLDVASAVRDRGLFDAGLSGLITYSRKVFVPLTQLCRDRCHYCTFVKAPAEVPEPFLLPSQVLEIAARGAELECKEALFTLGDRPESRWPQARQWLAERGYESTLDYLRAMAVLVLEETGLLPHLNPGVMSWSEMQRLRPVAPSAGLMLETASDRLWRTLGQPHFGSVDKEPAVRLRVLQDAGRLSIPFTTGILVGIGETRVERVEALLAIRKIANEFGHIQEVIVQNFRAKPDTVMRGANEPSFDEFRATVAVARLLLGPGMRIQVPPNLSDSSLLGGLVHAGIDDWGGVSPLTPDHVNPERPWPQLETLAKVTTDSGFSLAERLTAHPRYLRRTQTWLDPRVQPHVASLVTARGLAREGTRPHGQPWQEPDASWASSGRTDLHEAVDRAGRLLPQRSDTHEAFGNWDDVRRNARDVRPSRLESDLAAAMRVASTDPAALLEPEYESLALALLHADGEGLDAVTRLADEIRRDTVGDEVTFVVNRNINFTNVCYTGCRFCAFAQRKSDPDAYTLSVDEVARRATEAWAVGATEVCMQGGIDPALPGTAYADLVLAVKAAVPDMHVHAFSPMEIVNGASRSGVSIDDFLASLQAVGLDTLPGTAAEILDDDIRWILTKGKLPTSSWVEVVTAAHQRGIRTSSTMMFGHVDQPRHWLQHFRVLAAIQDETGGFTEFVPLPFVHHSAPLYLAGASRPGPTTRENRIVPAAARLLLHTRIDHIQASWVKLGADGCRQLLVEGANDLGGTLMEETISRMAGSQHGSSMSVTDLAGIAESLGRPARMRTTTYGVVDPERFRVAQAEDGVLAAKAQ